MCLARDFFPFSLCKPNLNFIDVCLPGYVPGGRVPPCLASTDAPPFCNDPSFLQHGDAAVLHGCVQTCFARSHHPAAVRHWFYKRERKWFCWTLLNVAPRLSLRDPFQTSPALPVCHARRRSLTPRSALLPNLSTPAAPSALATPALP